MQPRRQWQAQAWGKAKGPSVPGLRIESEKIVCKDALSSRCKGGRQGGLARTAGGREDNQAVADLDGGTVQAHPLRPGTDVGLHKVDDQGGERSHDAQIGRAS